ncbi:acyl-CoA dehydratase activase [Halothermothrix orenii]|uniref:Putative CoA-substrate-specific enzyme activase n=1 Tax=Halothermothrix orenii (strain H 168 / OCM 544 / DSM 9562) TaxID=373903 RepID=B8CYI7_HALOH|nr:acyl-CoA dehydratase activase [Halothermothrix orenii]ACL70356.1 putative CoA-substrate-specific enzyme activase [Halothermothrix orenii H 168]
MLIAGLDIGSRTTKTVILEDGDLVSWEIMNTGARTAGRAREVIKKALRKIDYSLEQVKRVVATGYGRLSIPFADREITEITAHALGVHHKYPNTRTVIDIGGQDSKVIRLDANGRVDDFVMNDKCAAGTGRFLEVMAETLEVPLEEIGPLSLKTDTAAPISSTCTVFAESEVISLIADGVEREDILRGLHTAIVKRITGMARQVGIKEEVTLSGGVSLNKGVRQLLEKELEVSLNIPHYPQLMGAYGAALLGYREMCEIN